MTYENCYWRPQSSCLRRDTYIAKAPSQVILISKPHHFSRDLGYEGTRWTNCRGVPFRSQLRCYGKGLGRNFSCCSLLSSRWFGSSCTSVSWELLHPCLLLSLTLSYFFSLQQKRIEFAYVTNEENFTNSSATMRSLSYKKIQCFNIFNELTLST